MRLGTPKTQIVGVDIGGTKTAGALIDPDGTVQARVSMETPRPAGGAAMAETAARIVETLAAQADAPIAAVGVGTVGVVDVGSGEILAASDLFVGWAGFPLGESLARRLGVPVRVENDVNAFLLGEAAWGAASGSTDALGIMLGTGVGGALMLDGALRQGAYGSAGEIGHTPGYGELVCTCGRVGHLESVASGTAIRLRYAAATGHEVASAQEVAQRARAGDAAAQAVFADAARAVALASASAATLVDIAHVVVGGGLIGAWDLLEPTIESTLAVNTPVSGAPLRITRGTLGADAVALGAASLVAEYAIDPHPAAGQLDLAERREFARANAS